MSKLFLYICLPLILLTSCIPDPVEIDVPQAESKIVVASQMLLDQAVLIQLSRSFNALTETPTDGDSLDEDFLDALLLDSARVIMTGPNGPDTLFKLDRGFYLRVGEALTLNESYNLSIFDSVSGKQVFSQATVLPPTEFTEVGYAFETERFELADTFFLDSTFKLQLQFDDLVGENYYMVNLYNLSQGEGQPSTNPLSLQEGLPTFTYTDALLNGPTFYDTLTYRNVRQGDTLAVTLAHVSKSYYEFLLARERSGSSFFANLLGEPVSYPSNIEGGFGFFNLHFPTTRVLVVE
ncbi:MAG: DUF4249 domain-containing protein [Bacteroidota bacterium]